MSKPERSIEGRLGRLENRLSAMERAVSEILEAVKALGAVSYTIMKGITPVLDTAYKKAIKAAVEKMNGTAAGRK